MRISPPEASVTVGGLPRALLAGGELALEGEAGESFEVKVENHGASRQLRVVLSREGGAEPSAIELAPPAVAAASVATSAGRGAPVRQAPVAAKVEPAATKPLAPPPSGAPRIHGDL